MKNKGYLTLIGFALLLMGLLSIILSLVGLNLTFLGFLNDIGNGFAFIVQLVMVVAGAIMMYLSKVEAE